MWELELQQIEALLQPEGGDAKRSQDMISALRTQLLGLSIFGGTTAPSSPEQQLEELTALRNLLEFACLCAVEREDEIAFQAAAEELLGIYYDARLVERRQLSPRQTLLLSLILTWHLSRGRIEEVHVILRRLDYTGTSVLGVPLKEREAQLLAFPMVMDRNIMDGNIAKVLAIMGSGQLVDRRFQWFSHNLVTTLRRRAAQALEAGYKQAPFDHVMKVLVFEQPDDLIKFIDHEKRRQDMLEGQLTLIQAGHPEIGTPLSIAKPLVRTASVEERVSTPTQLPKAGEGRVFSSLARTSSAGQPAGSGAFALKATQPFSREFVQSALDVEFGPHGQQQSTGDLVGAGFGGGSSLQRPRIHWELGTNEKNEKTIYFREMTKPKPLIPAYDLMSQWLDYAVDLEAVV